jgi:hypothetical protein
VHRRAVLGAVLGALAAVVLASAGAAFATKSGVWSGSTNQPYNGGGMPFALQVSKGRVTAIFYGANFTGSSQCAESDSPDAQRLDPNTGFAGLKIKHRKFAAKFEDSYGEHITVSGRFKGRNLTGSFSDSFSTAGIHCSTGKVRFTAKPGGSLI